MLSFITGVPPHASAPAPGALHGPRPRPSGLVLDARQHGDRGTVRRDEHPLPIHHALATTPESVNAGEGFLLMANSTVSGPILYAVGLVIDSDDGVL
jgi:hypothetical protein